MCTYAKGGASGRGTPVEGISVLGRNTQGVRIIRMGDDERVVAVARLVDRDDVEDIEEEAPPEGDGRDESGDGSDSSSEE